MKITSEKDLDATLFGWLREAHAWYGQQGQLAEKGRRGAEVPPAPARSRREE